MKNAVAVGFRRPRALVAISLLLLLLFSLAFVGQYVLTRPVAFDGAMNLQVAQSLAQGRGYVRDYEGVRPFPAEVQTNAPYVVPAALVFATFGVGLVQSQAVNFIYMLGFLALVVAIGTKLHGFIGGILSALALIVVPGFTWIGMNGWGELVALFWWLAGTILLLKDRAGGQHKLAPVVGAVCLGLAVATKTVMLIGLGATTSVYAMWVLLSHRDDGREAVKKLLVFAALVALPLIAVELWRLESMGLSAYERWWGVQSSAITAQTGVLDAPRSAGRPKLFGHFDILASLTGLPRWLMAFWLLAPLVWSVSWLARRGISTTRDRLLLAITLVVFVYCVWWLMITPDTHVRLRRIEIGLILNQWLWLFCLFALLQVSRPLVRTLLAGAGVLVFTIIAAVFAHGTVVDLRKKSVGNDAFHIIIATIKALPPSATLFGKGFLSAPSIALYADRRVNDIDGYTAGQLAAMGSGYIVVDGSAAKGNRFAPELLRYAHTTVLDYRGFQLHRLDFSARLNPFDDDAMQSSQTRNWVDYLVDRSYPLSFGFLKPSAAGWRWARTDAELLLKYSGEPSVVLSAYKPNQPYARQGALDLTVRLDGCLLGTQALQAGKHELKFPVGEQCRPGAGQNARLQIESDNLLPPTALSLQQYSYVLSAAGFRD